MENLFWNSSLVRGAPPEGDIDDLMSPGKGEGQRRDGDGRELDLPREFEVRRSRTIDSSS